MKHERPSIPPPQPPDKNDLLFGRLIDQLYWLKNRVRRLEQLGLVLGAAVIALVAKDIAEALGWL